MAGYNNNTWEPEKLVLVRNFHESSPHWKAAYEARKKLDLPNRNAIKIIERYKRSKRAPHMPCESSHTYYRRGNPRNPEASPNPLQDLYAGNQFVSMLRDRKKLWDHDPGTEIARDYLIENTKKKKTHPSQTKQSVKLAACTLNLPVELFVDMAREHLDIKSQWLLWNVNKGMRTYVDFMLKTAAASWGEGSGKPIRFLQPMTKDTQSPPLTEEELDMLKLQLPRCGSQKRRRRRSHPFDEANPLNDDDFFVPARLHQAVNLDAETKHLFEKVHFQRVSYIVSEDRIRALPPPSSPPRWMDLSQFEFNPYLIFLLSNRIRFASGYCYVTLLPGAKQVTDSPCVGTSFYDAICAGFATKPPCRRLQIYLDDASFRSFPAGNGNIPITWSPSTSEYEPGNGYITNEQGITVGDFICGLARYADVATDRWRTSLHAAIRSIELNSRDESMTDALLEEFQDNTMPLSPAPRLRLGMDDISEVQNDDGSDPYYIPFSNSILPMRREDDQWYPVWTAWEKEHSHDDEQVKWAIWESKHCLSEDNWYAVRWMEWLRESIRERMANADEVSPAS